MTPDRSNHPTGDERDRNISTSEPFADIDDDTELEQYGVWVKTGPEDVDETDEADEFGNVDADGAALDAPGVLALDAALGLGARGRFVVSQRHLVEVLHALFGRLLGHLVTRLFCFCQDYSFAPSRLCGEGVFTPYGPG